MARTPSILSRAPMLLGLCLLVCCGSLAVWLNGQQRTEERWVRHTFEVVRQLDRVDTAILRVKIARQDRAISEADNELRALDAAVGAAATLTRDNRQQQIRVRRLEHVVSEWLARLESASPVGQWDGAVASDAAMASALRTVDQLRQAEGRLRRGRIERSSRLANTAFVVLIGSLGLAFALGAVALAERRRRVVMLRTANARLAEENGKLEAAERQSASALARLSEGNRLLSMAEAVAQIGHWRLDLVEDTLIWSDAVRAIHGVPADYVPRLYSAIDAYHPDDRDRVKGAVERALANGEDFELSGRLIRTDGSTPHVLIRGRVERSATGVVVALFGVLQDVTASVEAEAALRVASDRIAERNRLLTMAQAMGRLGHWRLDRDTREMFWSDEILKIYGFEPGAAPGVERALSLYHPDDVERVKATLAEALSTGVGYSSTARIVRPDGRLVHILTRAEVEFDACGRPAGLFGVAQDVTEQVLAETRRQEQAAQYRLITEQASDVIVITDAAGRCIFISPSCRSVLGYEPEEMIGRTARDYIPDEDEAVIEQQVAALTARPAGEVVQVRFRMRRKDGVFVWMDVAARVAEHQGSPRVISVCRDVTEQVGIEAELRVARRQAEDAASAKASFLANMSHEIRTPMNGVIGFTELLLAGELRPDQRRQVELIADSGQAMMRLLNDILDLSKVEAGQMRIADEPFDLPHALRACMKLVAPAIAKKGLACDLDLSGALPGLVRGDGLRLRQILLNVLGNAVKFTERGGIAMRAAPGADGSIVIEVADTGIGIAPDRQEAIFGEFVQADSGIVARFGGTGLGLAISAQLARLMAGSLRLESEPGQGSRFYLTLPLPAVADRRSSPRITVGPEGEAAPEQSDGTAARVLVAEDHDVNQMLAGAMLDQLGHPVDIATDGAQAVALVQAAEARGEPYAIVLMDMQMPVMGGVNAARAIRADGIGSERLPIVALTANAYADDVASCLDAGMQAHLAKPLHLAELRTVLRRWIRSPAETAAPAPPLLSAGVRDRYRLRKESALNDVAALLRSGQFAAMDVAALSDTLHKLAGTAAMFGDGPLGEQAHALETGLANWTDDERDRELPGALTALLAAA